MKFIVEERVKTKDSFETVRTINFETEKEARDYADIHNLTYATTSDNRPIDIEDRERYFFYNTIIEDKDLQYWSVEEIKEGLAKLITQINTLKDSYQENKKHYKSEKTRLKKVLRNYKRKYREYLK